MSRFFKLILRFILRQLPLILFPKLNVFIFRKLGYNVSYSSRVYSSVEIMGDINVTIDEGTFIGHRTIITGGQAAIKIGKYCDISDRVSIVSGTHEIDKEGIRSAGRGIGKDIHIGNGVWIGYGAIILPGVTIGDKAVIGAGCVVSKDVSTKTIVVGNPMKVLRDI